MEKQNLDELVVGGKNVFPNADKWEEGLKVWGEAMNIDDEKKLQDIVKEVAQEEGMTEEEVMKHLQAVSKMMNSGYGVPKFKNNKQKAKDKSKRKQAKKSRKRNR